MDDSGNTKDDLKLPTGTDDADKLARDLKAEFSDGKELTVTVVSVRPVGIRQPSLAVLSLERPALHQRPTPNCSCSTPARGQTCVLVHHGLCQPCWRCVYEVSNHSHGSAVSMQGAHQAIRSAVVRLRIAELSDAAIAHALPAL